MTQIDVADDTSRQVGFVADNRKHRQQTEVRWCQFEPSIEVLLNEALIRRFDRWILSRFGTDPPIDCLRLHCRAPSFSRTIRCNTSFDCGCTVGILPVAANRPSGNDQPVYCWSSLILR